MNSTIKSVKTLLTYTFGLVPILAGLDKFTNILTDWSNYVSVGMASMLPMSPESFMVVVGIIEIIAGIVVFVKTKLGAYIVSAWLVGIALSLIFSLSYLDVAVRDLVMATGAFCLGQLSQNEPTKVNTK